MFSLARRFSNFAIKTIRELAMEGSHSKGYSPSPKAVILVKKDLVEKIHLPLELVDTILDYAEYWPRTTTICRTTPDTQITIRAGSASENRFLLRSYPLGFDPDGSDSADYQMTDQYQTTFSTLLPQPWPTGQEVPRQSTHDVLSAWIQGSNPRTEHPCRKLVFTVTSHDQGWGGAGFSGRYEGSYTWFDVGKEELSAFKEGVALEAWGKAPWPQFRLCDPSQYIPRTQSTDKSLDVHSKLVCSLKTIRPESVVAPSMDPESDSDTDSDAESLSGENLLQGDDFNGNGSMVGPPDPLNPGIQTLSDDQPPDPPLEPHKPEYMFKHELCPVDDTLQRNMTASSEFRTHTITWMYNDDVQPESQEAAHLAEIGRGKNTANGEFVRSMKLGDCVTVWGKARFPGWTNHIREVQIDVYWAV